MSRPGRRPLGSFLRAALVLVPAFALAQPPALVPRKLSFADPGVVDLATARLWRLPGNRPAVPIGTLAPNLARGILNAQPRPDDAPERLRPSPLIGEAAQKAEASLLPADPAVKREGTSLVVSTRSGNAVLFRDLRLPSRPGQGPEGTSYLYAGRVGASRFVRIAVASSREPQASFLVSPEDGKAVHVRDGIDVASLATDGSLLLAFNDFEAPFTLSVTSLAPSGPAVEIACRATGSGKAWGLVKGWRGNGAVDVVVALGERGRGERFPLRLERTPAGWTAATADPSRLAAAGGLACFAGPIPKSLM